MDKSTLRKIFLEKRGLITAEDARQAGEAMAALLSGGKFWEETRSVFCFISVDGEPDTSPIILNAIRNGKTVCVPRTGKGRRLEAVPVTGEPDTLPLAIGELNSGAISQLTKDWPLFYGIPEPPASYKAIGAELLDLVIVPSLAVDIWGRRLGHGGGYYDHFIAQFQAVKKRPLFAAIQFSALVQKDPLPYEEHDMKVDLIVTEKEIRVIY